MLMNDSYLFDAGFLFFAAWSIVVAAVCMAAFGRDLFPAQARQPLEQTAVPDHPPETPH